MSSFKTSFISFIVILILIQLAESANKYSKEANTKPKKQSDFSMPDNIKELRALDKPFRMHKLNLVWIKAKHRLTDAKLQSLFSDLKIQDKEEIAYKHQKSDGKDEDGLEEARLRKKLTGIMSTYDLLEHFEPIDTTKPIPKKPKPYKDNNNYVSTNIFKDKRLNQLWAKAERGGFTHEELETLKEEFEHHQNKIDEYYSLLSEVEAGDPEKHKNSIHEDHDQFNELEAEEDELSNDISGKKKDYLSKRNMLKEKHLGVRSGFDHLEGIAAQGPKHKEFVEPKVQGLWRLAKEAKFSPGELDSLKEELHHYEKRLMKLRHLHTEAALESARNGKDYQPNATHETHIKRHALNVEKLHKDLESKIMQKHSEL